MVESKTYIATPPGATIKELLEDRGMTQKEFATRMAISEKHLSNLINGEVRLTPDMAERLELVLNVPAKFWNNLEAIYEGKLARANLENNLDNQIKLAKKYPYNELSKEGILPSVKKNTDKVYNLCKFFEVSDLKQIDDNSNLIPIACRQLSDTERGTYAKRALAQFAKLQARNMDVSPFNLRTLKGSIKTIRALTTHRALDFSDTLVKILGNAGVALVYLPQIKGSFLHGITFYDNQSPKVIIGITLRGKDADKFWFSLFHEISHILQKHIFQDNEITAEQESSADAMATEILLPHKAMENFYDNHDYSIDSLQSFAIKMGTDVGIVIGRLQHDKKLQYSQYTQYKAKYEL